MHFHLGAVSLLLFLQIMSMSCWDCFTPSLSLFRFLHTQHTVLYWTIASFSTKLLLLLWKETPSLFGWCLTLAALCSLNEDSELQHRHRNERETQFTGSFCETAKSAKGENRQCDREGKKGEMKTGSACSRLSWSAGERVLLRTHGCRRGGNRRPAEGHLKHNSHGDLQMRWRHLKTSGTPFSPLRESSGEKTTLMFNVQMCSKQSQLFLTFFGRSLTGWWLMGERIQEDGTCSCFPERANVLD